MEVYELVEEVAFSAADVRSGIERLLQALAEKYPRPVWTELAELPYEADTAYLKGWLTEVLRSEPPAPEIRAYWFGLFNPTDDQGEAYAALYLSGSTRYSSEDADGDWACWDDDSYLPEGRYARSSVLESLYRRLWDTEDEEDEAVSEAEYVLCLGYAALTLRQICPELEPQLLAGVSGSRPVVVGYDSGDWITLGEATPQGFVRTATTTQES